MRNIKIASTTDNSREYKMVMRGYKLGCPICGPNRGCNYRAKKKQRNWKKFRKTKWKEK